MNFEALPFLLVGIVFAVWPYGVAMVGEQLDAIGSKRSPSEVEPADWNVTLTKYIGWGITLFTFLWFVFGFK